MEHVFISYSSNDSNIARAVCSFLESNGFRCWIAPRDVSPGIRFPEAIVNAIRKADLVLLVASKASLSSQQVTNEIVQAGALQKLILPFLIEEVSIPDNIAYYVGGTQWIDAKANLKDHFPYLLDSVHSILDSDETPIDSSANHKESPLRAEYREIYAKVAQRYDEALLWAFDQCDYRQSPLHLLYLGARDVDLLKHQIGLLDKKPDATICICESEKYLNALEKCFEDDSSIRFTVIPFDENFEENLRLELALLGIKKFALVFSDERYRSIPSLSSVFRFFLKECLEPRGSIVLRTFDDGTKLCHPDAKEVLNKIVAATSNLVGASDRCNGRKIYSDLRRAGFRNIQMKYVVNDTIGLSVEERLDLFDESFSYRIDYFEQMRRNNPDNPLFAREHENMKRMLRELEDLFCDDAFFYMETNFFIVAKR